MQPLYPFPKPPDLTPPSVFHVWRQIHKLSGKHPPHPAPVLHIHNSLIYESPQVATEFGAYFSQIVITSCKCKLLERIVNIRRMWYLEYHNLISTNQFGFHHDQSTADPLAYFETSSSFAHHESVLAVIDL
ncbi:uncharacterized protein [Penaeus vannamei]|uniref:uncharacterized protein n=1 Tax=Penaeus vannamei TaxID=6689 RepID=UPI00387F953A